MTAGERALFLHVYAIVWASPALGAPPPIGRMDAKYRCRHAAAAARAAVIAAAEASGHQLAPGPFANETIDVLDLLREALS